MPEEDTQTCCGDEQGKRRVRPAGSRGAWQGKGCLCRPWRRQQRSLSECDVSNTVCRCTDLRNSCRLREGGCGECGEGRSEGKRSGPRGVGALAVTQ